MAAKSLFLVKVREGGNSRTYYEAAFSEAQAKRFAAIRFRSELRLLPGRYLAMDAELVKENV